MKKEEIAVVITTQFLARNSEPLLRSLRAVVRLPLHHVIVVTDEKEPDGERLAREAIAQMKEALERNGMTHEIVVVNAYSTARRWWPGICAGFRKNGIQGTLNFPGDLAQEVSETQIAVLIEALQTFRPAQLLLFDYDSNDSFKQDFDKLFLLPILRVIHPELLPSIEKLNQSKLRTEIFCISREPFEAKRNDFGLSWGTDPTVQLIINSLIRGLPIRSTNLQSCADDGGTRNDASGQTLQIVRIAHQTVEDAIISIRYGKSDQRANNPEGLQRLYADLAAEVQSCLLRNSLRIRQTPAAVTIAPVKLNRSLLNRARQSPNVTCVTFFESSRRASPLTRCIEFVQRRLAFWLQKYLDRRWIQLMPDQQIHGTIFGLEAMNPLTTFVNENWFRANGNERNPMDMSGLAGYLKDIPRMKIRFGGFAKATDPRQFESTFTINSDGLFVLKGWPHSNGAIDEALWKFREGAKKYNVLHKWAKDNDLFMVMAHVTEKYLEGDPQEQAEFLGALSTAQEAVRDEMARELFDLDLSQEHICVLRYEFVDLRMTRNVRIVAAKDLSERSLKNLYLDETRPWLSAPDGTFGMGEYRAVYAVPEGIRLLARLHNLYSGKIDSDDPLSRLVKPFDLRGEVQAWGGPHITVLDALTFPNTGKFEALVREICENSPNPVVTPRKLAVWGNNLVIVCDSPQLQDVRARLIAATRDCVERYPFTDEEVQRARLQIQEFGSQPEEQLETLDRALKQYKEAGKPALPSSRHFRMNYLIRLTRAVKRAVDADSVPKRVAELLHYLTFGEPHWYASAGGLHLTIASGLNGSAEMQTLARELEPSVLADFPTTRLSRLAIMTQTSDNLVSVQFLDSLTEKFLPEIRPGFRAAEWVNFQTS